MTDRPFNREKFLLWLLAALLGWQASIFTYATVKCSRVKLPSTIQDTCPNLAENYGLITQVTLGAVLGLLQVQVRLVQLSTKTTQDRPPMPPVKAATPPPPRQHLQPELSDYLAGLRHYICEVNL